MRERNCLVEMSRQSCITDGTEQLSGIAYQEAGFGSLHLVPNRQGPGALKSCSIPLNVVGLSSRWLTGWINVISGHSSVRLSGVTVSFPEKRTTKLKGRTNDLDTEMRAVTGSSNDGRCRS